TRGGKSFMARATLCRPTDDRPVDFCAGITRIGGMVEHSGGQSDGPEGPEGQERQPGPAIAARTDDGRVILVTPDGMAVEGAPDAPDAPDASGDEEDDVAEGSGED